MKMNGKFKWQQFKTVLRWLVMVWICFTLFLMLFASLSINSTDEEKKNMNYCNKNKKWSLTLSSGFSRYSRTPTHSCFFSSFVVQKMRVRTAHIDLQKLPDNNSFISELLHITRFDPITLDCHLVFLFQTLHKKQCVIPHTSLTHLYECEYVYIYICACMCLRRTVCDYPIERVFIKAFNSNNSIK